MLTIQIIQVNEAGQKEITSTMVISSKVDLPKLEATPLLEWIFRQYNAVDGAELCTLLLVPGYSLSVGNFVLLTSVQGRRMFECMGCGWEEKEIADKPLPSFIARELEKIRREHFIRRELDELNGISAPAAKPSAQIPPGWESVTT
jgi:hypothetical protein